MALERDEATNKVTIRQIRVDSIDEKALLFGGGTIDRITNDEDDLEYLLLSFKQNGFWDEDPTHPHYSQSIIHISPTVYPCEFEPQKKNIEDGSDAVFGEQFNKKLQEYDKDRVSTWLDDVLTKNLFDFYSGRNRMVRK